MQGIVDYFAEIPTVHRTLILVSGLLFFWSVEGIIPLRFLKKNRIPHAGINLFFTLTTLIVNVLFATLIVFCSDWVVSNELGIIQWVNLPLWAEIVICLLILDLVGAYLIHWIEHKVYWLWKFHIIHHSDLEVDTTTALRHHPGESVFRATFTTIAVILAGAPIGIVMIYQSISALLSQFNHSNWKLPGKLDQILSIIIVTPRMHHVHHHYIQPYTDQNYGNIFSIWDHVFGTFGKLDFDEIQYGVDIYQEEGKNIPNLLKIPFDGSNYRRSQ